MATVYKRTKKKNEPWTIQWVDHEGKRRTAKGFTDKGLTEQLAAKLEGEARMRSHGLVDTEAEAFAKQKAAPIAEHLSAFEDSMAETTREHVKLTMTRARRVVEGCGAQSLADLSAEKVEAFLRSLRREQSISRRTYNHYLQAIDAFCNWCVGTKRLLANPLTGVGRLNTEVEIRHKRRALTADEVAQLVASARASAESIRCFTGEQRARIYILSYMTGLRRGEIASLTPRSFQLNTTPPTLTLEAASSKHRRRDVLPLHPDLVTQLRDWLAGMQPGEKLFPRLARRRTSLMVKKDLERVGIPYVNDDGIADFHAAGRHTHITELLRNGASLPEAQKLARHSDIKMTMRYTHIGIVDQAKAVANLPALHRRCISGGAEGQGDAATGTAPAHEKSLTHCRSSELGVSCHPVAPDDEVEAAGIEPVGRCAPSSSFDTTYGDCPYCGAAPALHNGSSEWQLPAEFDADLQKLISAWPELPRAIREEIARQAGYAT
jgi:integrase